MINIPVHILKEINIFGEQLEVQMVVQMIQMAMVFMITKNQTAKMKILQDLINIPEHIFGAMV